MNAIGILLDDLSEEARLNWDCLPAGGYGEFTYDFPVIRAVIPGATEQKIIDTADKSQTPVLVEAAKNLERQGVKAIVGACGFLAIYQQEVAQAVSVPVALSSLIQVPLVSQMIGGKHKVGIITWSKRFLGEKQFNGAGWSSKDIPVVVGKGLDEFPGWKAQNYGPELIKQLEANVLQIARDLIKENPDIGAFVFECAGIPGFGRSVQKAIGLPVFNISTLIKMLFSGINFI